MAIKLITSAAGGGLIPPVNTTGADFIVCVLAANGTTAANGITDNYANTWTLATSCNDGTSGAAIYYCFNPTVGIGHRFSPTDPYATYEGLSVAAFSGIGAGSLDKVNNNVSATSVSSIQPGSITPTNSGELLIAGLGINSSSITATVDSGFTMAAVAAGSGILTSYLAFLAQGSAAAVDPTFTKSASSSGNYAVIASFIPGVVPTPPPPPTVKTVTVKASGGNYTTLEAALTGEQADLVALNTQLNIELYASASETSGGIDTSTLTYNTNANCYIHIVVPAGERHSGVWDDSKYYLLQQGAYGASINLTIPYTRFTGIQFKLVPTISYGNWFGGIVANTASGIQIDKCIFWVPSSAYSNSIHPLRLGSWPCAVTNCLFDLYLASEAINTDSSNGIFVYNCTFISTGNSPYAIFRGASIFYLKNNIVDGFQHVWESIRASSPEDYNSSDLAATSWDSGGPGPGTWGPHDRYSQTFSFVDAANADYALTASDTGAKGYGVDLSTDSNYPITTDISGATRTAPWDIGAFRVASSNVLGAQVATAPGSVVASAGGSASVNVTGGAVQADAGTALAQSGVDVGVTGASTASALGTVTADGNAGVSPIGAVTTVAPGAASVSTSADGVVSGCFVVVQPGIASGGGASTVGVAGTSAVTAAAAVTATGATGAVVSVSGDFVAAAAGAVTGTGLAVCSLFGAVVLAIPGAGDASGTTSVALGGTAVSAEAGTVVAEAGGSAAVAVDGAQLTAAAGLVGLEISAAAMLAGALASSAPGTATASVATMVRLFGAAATSGHGTVAAYGAAIAAVRGIAGQTAAGLTLPGADVRQSVTGAEAGSFSGLVVAHGPSAVAVDGIAGTVWAGQPVAAGGRGSSVAVLGSGLVGSGGTLAVSAEAAVGVPGAQTLTAAGTVKAGIRIVGDIVVSKGSVTDWYAASTASLIEVMRAGGSVTDWYAASAASVIDAMQAGDATVEEHFVIGG